jgi:hypothetical protein
MYFVPNMLAFIGILYFDFMLVDMVPVMVSASYYEVVGCFLLLVGSLIAIVVLAKIFEKYFVDGSDCQSKPPKLFGYIVFFIQLCTFLVALFLGYGRAGSKGGDANVIVTIVSYLHADIFFMLYYAHARASAFPKYNLILFVVSNVLRGWGGVWLILFLIESFYFLRGSNVWRAYYKIMLVSLIGLAAFPFANSIREQARGAEVGELLYFESYIKLFNRMQHVSNVVLISQESEDVLNDIQSGIIVPWYINNPIFMRLIPGKYGEMESLQKYIASRYLVDFSKIGDGYYVDDLSWYTNTGFSGWIFLMNWYVVPVYVIYVLFMMWLPYWAVGRFIGVMSIVPVLHLASFLYVFHGWMDVQFTFVVSVLVYVFLYKFLVPQNFISQEKTT